MEIIKTNNDDGTRKTCPNGASIKYPIGTLVRVHVGDKTCLGCPCYQAHWYNDNGVTRVACTFPEIAE